LFDPARTLKDDKISKIFMEIGLYQGMIYPFMWWIAGFFTGWVIANLNKKQ